MNNEEKITNAQNIEEQEKLKQKYEEEKSTLNQEILNLRGKITKKNDEIFELQKNQESLVKDRDEWKTEARRNRRIEQEQKQTKAQNDFKTEYLKLQEQKGWTWDEVKGWTKR